MICDKLYQLAFEYKKTKLWRVLWDTEIFAIKLSDGRIGYISIMGFRREHCAFALYIGEEGFDSLREAVREDGFLSTMEFSENMLRQRCLQCEFCGKDELSEEEREEVKTYTRAHKIKLAGRNAYPIFVKYQPYHCPWHLQTQKEQEDLCEALSAAIEMARLLQNKTPHQLGLISVEDDTTIIPMLEKQKDGYVLTKTELPEEKPVQFPKPEASNDIGVANLKKAKRKGVWECGLIRFPEPLRVDQEEIPVFPLILLAVESATDFLLPVAPAAHYEEEPEKLLNHFIEALVQQNICPKRIKVRDERTLAFVKAFCERLKIAVSIEEKLPALDNAEDDFWDRFDRSEEEEFNEMKMMLDRILELDASELNKLPSGLVDQFEKMLETGALPAEIEEKIRQLILFANSKEPDQKKVMHLVKKMVPAQSYVISVFLGTGCYRHIKISDNSTLFELHKAILDAFGFVDDHAHAFFMDNTKWSDQDSYFMEGMEDSRKATQRCRLKQAGLHKDMAFKYVFDFGEEWTFQCKVLKEVEGATEKPVIIKSKGDAPSQYEDIE